TCEDQEDHVAMSTTAARRAREVVANARRVVAIELLAAARGLWWRSTNEAGVRLGAGTAAALEAVEAVLGDHGEDLTPSEAIERLADAVAGGRIAAAAESAVGP